MQVQVNTDNHIRGREDLSRRVEDMLNDTLERFSDRITRVEVHLGDTNSSKSGPDDMRCMLEARVKGHQPIAVAHHAEDLLLAIQGATDKLERALDSALGRLEERRKAPPGAPTT